jgi:Na+-transporting NADH:ubiquinone oxidoreductase subunit A
MEIRTSRGLRVEIDGAPEQRVRAGNPVSCVGLDGRDYPGFRPGLRVETGQRVQSGQTLFVDRRRPEIAVTAPGAGIVGTITHGRRRTLESLVIDLEGDGALGFPVPARGEWERGRLQELLLASGSWPAFLARPFGRIPDPRSMPDAIFVRAMDSSPLAPAADVVLAMMAPSFDLGVEALTFLTDGPVHVCQAPGPPLTRVDHERVRCTTFRGRHPAGLSGTHIHFLSPVGRHRVVWAIDYQEVVAIGHLLATGRVREERVVALAGPGVRTPSLIRTRAGACLADLLDGETQDGDQRVLSGSVLSGRRAEWLGRRDSQITVLPEPARQAGFFRRSGGFSTALHGRPAAFLPLEAFEEVVPLDLLPVPLLRALLAGDVESAERLGCLELLEEDVALLSYVCPSKHDYGVLLRSVLDTIEKEGA